MPLREALRGRPPEPHGGRRGLNARFQQLVEGHDWAGKVALDVGCGSGAATVLLATLGARAVGADLDAQALIEADARASEAKAGGAQFVCADVELADYRALAHAPRGLDGVVAHLCFSNEVARRAQAGLKEGGLLIVRCFHRDMWKEAGASSPFAKSPQAMRRLLGSLGFDVTHLEVQRRTQRFASFAAFERDFLEDAHRRTAWKEDGRLDALRRSFRRGNRTLSEAFLIVEAVKASRIRAARGSGKEPRIVPPR